MGEETTGERAAAAPGRLLGRGRDADVYDLGDGRVLRRYRVDYDHANEITALRYLHAQGFPVPLLHEADGGRDMIFERADGPTMLADLLRHPWRARSHARLLADLHRRLHALAAPPGLPGPAPDPGRGVILHLDLHPANVLLSPTGPVVIDWSNAAAGPAGSDLAHTLVVMAVSEVPDLPWPLRPFVALLRRRFLRAFLAAAHADPAPFLAGACRRRLSDPNLLPSEARRINAMLARS
ncbi:phosphotransferase [Actinocrinis puniceicyclus]|uniref:phosphotransferase n=1 Tax=Actinocrinis puniceicyclus TaxID=977794 RepID=UPI0028AD817E|nr:phosphotransferase [Actinocrinis puniceicyclus]